MLTTNHSNLAKCLLGKWLNGIDLEKKTSKSYRTLIDSVVHRRPPVETMPPIKIILAKRNIYLFFFFSKLSVYIKRERNISTNNINNRTFPHGVDRRLQQTPKPSLLLFFLLVFFSLSQSVNCHAKWWTHKIQSVV